MTRKLFEIAKEIESDFVSNGKSVPIYMKPYLNAMKSLITINDMYYQDTARSVVVYFLANAFTWRGEVARRIKLELKRILDGKE